MIKPIRRIVTGHNAQGRSIIVSDGPSPHVLTLPGRTDFALTDLWVTDRAPASNAGSADAAKRRMTLEPARRLEKRTPAMANKGRVRVNADADLTIFDPATIIDRASYENAGLPSAGIPYVVIGGEVVVDRGEITSARPGRAIRAPQRPPS